METEFIRTRAAQVEKKILKAIEYFESLQSKPIPELIDDVGEFSDAAAEKILPMVKKDELAEWRKRAAKIERINKTLSEFEAGVIEKLTRRENAIVLDEIHKIVKRYTFLLANIGRVTTFIADSVRLGGQLYGEQFRKEIAIGLFCAVTLDLDGAVESAKSARDMSAEAIASIFILLASALILEGVEVVASTISAATYAKQLGPLKEVKAATVAAMKAVAFPQGTGRVRRRKVHRIRKRR